MKQLQNYIIITKPTSTPIVFNVRTKKMWNHSGPFTTTNLLTVPLILFCVSPNPSTIQQGWQKGLWRVVNKALDSGAAGGAGTVSTWQMVSSTLLLLCSWLPAAVGRSVPLRGFCSHLKLLSECKWAQLRRMFGATSFRKDLQRRCSSVLIISICISPR